ncbi:hypothetical protein AAC387_Pa05g1631 [Persea americana]
MIMQMTQNDKHDLYTASGLGKELSGALSESCQVHSQTDQQRSGIAVVQLCRSHHQYFLREDAAKAMRWMTLPMERSMDFHEMGFIFAIIFLWS